MWGWPSTLYHSEWYKRTACDAKLTQPFLSQSIIKSYGKKSSPKMKNVVIITYSHIVPNSYDFFSSMEYKKQIFEDYPCLSFLYNQSVKVQNDKTAS